MATLLRPTVTRYLDANGKVVAKGTPGARKVSGKARKWYASFPGPKGKRKRIPLSTDKQVAKRMLAKMVEQKELLSVGIDDSHLEHAVSPLAGHVAFWLLSLENKLERPPGKRHRDLLRGRLSKLIKLAGWRRLADIDADSTEKAMAKLRAEGKGTPRGRGTQTLNFYLQAAKQFCRWCMDRGRLKKNPLAEMKGGDVKRDRRHHRRPLELDEQKRLIKATESGPVRYGIDGLRRALLYRMALYTGFRASELRSLTWDCFDLERGEVTVAGAYSKNGKPSTQKLKPSLLERLRTWYSWPRRGKLWPDLPRYPSRMLRADLKEAGIPYKVDTQDGPLFADFHSFRHTFITQICLTDAPVKVLTDLARHASSRLTLETYAHVRGGEDKALVIAQLPDVDEQLALETSAAS
jgi:integrase